MTEIQQLRDQNTTLKKLVVALLKEFHPDYQEDPGYEEDGSGDKMLFGVEGSKSSWKCEGDGIHSCGCNVFRRLLNGKYRCNACSQVWVGES